MFQNPLMLAWAFGAVVPLVVHLLSQSRFRAVDWGAMMFLTGTGGSPQYSWQIKQWVLLLVRSMLVGLLAVALARPVLSERYAIPTAGLSTGGHATVVIIIDDSASMGYTQNGKSRLDQAREVALQILNGLPHGDVASLLIAGVPQDTLPTAPSADLQSIATKITDLTPAIGDADFADALTRAAHLLDHATTPDREIYLVCDRQALSWRRTLEKSFAETWRSARSTNIAPHLTVFPVGGNETDNVAIDSIRIVDAPAIRGQSTEVAIRVRNFGSTAAVSVPLSVWTGQRSLAEASVTVPAQAARWVRLPVRFPEAGSFVLSAAVKSTGLTFDDRLDYALPVLDPIRVLLISGDDLRSVNLRAALSPLASTGRAGLDPIAVTVPVADHWPALADFRVVALSNVADFTTDQVRDLEQFVYDGGNIWFIPGSHVRAEDYNRELYRDGSGVFPASLAGVTPASAKVDTTVQIADRQQAVFRNIASPKGLLAGVTINRFFTALPRVPDARVPAAFASGPPFMIETTAGRGRVMLSTVAFEDDWTNLQHTPVFQPLVQGVVRYLVAASAEARNLQPRQPIVETVNGSIDDRPATVQRIPGGRREAVIVKRYQDRTELRLNHADLPGTYRLRFRQNGAEKTINFVVSSSRIESDLTPLTQEQWQTLGRAMGIDRVEPTLASVTATVDRARGGREIWIDLLCGVLLLFGIETVLLRWWSRA